MAVTIGEMEVTTAPPPTSVGAPAPPQGASSGAADVKKEIEKAMHRHAERARRLWTY